MEKEDYLGDSVYVAIENGGFVLMTKNGGPATNVIFLDLEVAQNFINYVNRSLCKK